MIVFAMTINLKCGTELLNSDLPDPILGVNNATKLVSLEFSEWQVSCGLKCTATCKLQDPTS